MTRSIARKCLLCALLAIGLAPLSAQKTYDLAAKYVEGQSWVFDFVTAFEVSSDVIEGGSMAYQTRQRLKEEVEKIYEDGSLDLLITILHSETDGSETRPPSLDFDALVNLPLRKKVDKQGVVRSVEAVDEVPEKARVMYLQFKQGLLAFGRDLYLPQKPVAVGDAWLRETPISYDTPVGVADQLYTIQAKLNNILSYKGRDCYEILFDGKFTGMVDQGAAGILNGAVDGRILMDVNTCQFTKFEMRHDQSMNVREVDGEYSIRVKLTQTFEATDEEESIR